MTDVASWVKRVWATRWIQTTLRVSVILVVVVGLGYRLKQAHGQLERLAPPTGYGWFALAGLVYAVSLGVFGVIWHLAMCEQGRRWRLRSTLPAYMLSQLGKYVPGKALVVVLRGSALPDHPRRWPATVGTSVHETLLSMSIGALVAIGTALAVPGTAAGRSTEVVLSTVGIVGLVFLLMSLPPSAHLLQKLVSSRSGPGGWTPPSWSLVTMGTALLLVGWLGFAVSLALVLEGCGDDLRRRIDFLRVVVAATAARVLGFVSLLPGGVGSRDLAMVELLTPALAPEEAIVAVVSVRLTWLLSEALTAGVSWLILRLVPQCPEPELSHVAS